MPRVRYTGGGTYRVSTHSFEKGDVGEVSTGLADHLEDVDDFERVDESVTDVEFEEVDEGDGSGGQEDEPPDAEGSAETLTDDEIADRIDDGKCPWCDDYEGDGVPQHAASAHPEAWDDYKED